MPELPEVEVSRRSFENQIAGAQVLQLRMGKPLRWPLGCEPSFLLGRAIHSVGRRGKYLILVLDAGYVLLHLGMSGSLRFAHNLPAPGPHDHMDLHTTQGILRLHDPRRFGAVVYVDQLSDARAQKMLGHLGVEPLSEDFDLPGFQQSLKRRSSAVKQVLLAGDLVVGVGNIYASEALFLAGIRPSTRANRIGRQRVAALHRAIREVLSKAIDLGGSTLRDFSSANGQNGYFQMDAMVYGRGGQACRVCQTTVRQIKQGQRSSFFCPTCQRT